MQNAKNIQRLEILDGEKCNCVFDYLLKVLSPFTAPKAAHRIHNMTMGFLRIFKKENWRRIFRKWDFSAFFSNKKVEKKNGCWVIFQKEKLERKKLGNGMLGHSRREPTKRSLRTLFVALLLLLSQRLCWPCWCTAGGFTGDEQSSSPAAGLRPLQIPCIFSY